MRPSVRQWGAILFILSVLHNAEEAFGYTYANESGLKLLDEWGLQSLAVSPESFRLALGAVTAFAAVVAAWLVFARESRASLWVVRIWAAILVLNVFVPHLPAAILSGGYVPGIVTAVFLNLPIGIVCLRATASPRPGQP